MERKTRKVKRKIIHHCKIAYYKNSKVPRFWFLSEFCCFVFQLREQKGVRKNCSELMWAIGWVLRQGRWQIVVRKVVLAAARRPNEEPHVTLLLWSPAPAGTVTLACFLTLSLSPQPALLQCSHCCSSAGDVLSPWHRRQKVLDSMTFPLICLLPKDHTEGPRNIADVNLTMTLWWAGFAAPSWTVSV